MAALAASLVIGGGCVNDQAATISYAWTTNYPPRIASLMVGSFQILGEELQVAHGATRVQVTARLSSGSAVPVEVRLIVPGDSNTVLSGAVDIPKGMRFTLESAAGELPPGFFGGCGRRLGAVPIRGGAAGDSLAARWYVTDPSDFVGPC